MATGLGSIMSKVEAWPKSDEGKKRMDAKIKEYRSGKDSKVNSSGKTNGGSRILTPAQIKRLSKEFISILRKTAAASDLADSVMEHIESFDFTEPYIAPDGSMVVAVYMTDNPHRDSLYPKKYDGVDNIVALMNCGYSANGEVFGIWKDKRIVSLQMREGKWFMQKAADEFERLYGEEYGVTVAIAPEYSGAFGSGE